MDKKKFALIGDGGIASVIVDAYCQGKMPAYELVCICGMNQEKLSELSEKADCKIAKDIEELISYKPSIVAEAAAIGAAKAYALPVLKSGIDFLPLSIGAFADSEFFEEAKKTAAEAGARLYFSSGAIGGFDIMQTIALMGDAQAELVQIREASTYRGTGVFSEEPLQTGKKTLLFEGSATEAIKLLPKHINIGVATSLATVGPDSTNIKIYGDPNMPNDDDLRIKVFNDRASVEVNVYAKNSCITPWSVVSFLNNLASSVYFY